jgi:hypothetical protein
MLLIELPDGNQARIAGHLSKVRLDKQRPIDEKREAKLPDILSQHDDLLVFELTVRRNNRLTHKEVVKQRQIMNNPG